MERAVKKKRQNVSSRGKSKSPAPGDGSGRKLQPCSDARHGLDVVRDETARRQKHLRRNNAASRPQSSQKSANLVHNSEEDPPSGEDDELAQKPKARAGKKLTYKDPKGPLTDNEDSDDDPQQNDDSSVGSGNVSRASRPVPLARDNVARANGVADNQKVANNQADNGLSVIPLQDISTEQRASIVEDLMLRSTNNKLIANGEPIVTATNAHTDPIYKTIEAIIKR